MNITALGKYVVLRHVETEQDRKMKKAGMLGTGDKFIGDTAVAVVVSVGPDAVGFGEGDEVVLKRHGYDRLEVEGESWLLAKTDEIIGKVNRGTS